MRTIVLVSSLIAGVVVLIHGAAQAQSPPIKPGLWQVRTQREVDGQRMQMPDMSEHLKNMSPQQRQMMEAMMKQRGVDMGAGGDMRICLSKESLDAGHWQRQQGTCKTDYGSRTSSTWKWHTSCTDPASETDGEATFTSSDSYTVKTATTMSVQGQPRTTRMVLDSKWVGADCGDVKPITPRP